jgi:hypothetical protein
MQLLRTVVGHERCSGVVSNRSKGRAALRQLLLHIAAVLLRRSQALLQRTTYGLVGGLALVACVLTSITAADTAPHHIIIITSHHITSYHHHIALHPPA